MTKGGLLVTTEPEWLSLLTASIPKNKRSAPIEDLMETANYLLATAKAKQQENQDMEVVLTLLLRGNLIREYGLNLRARDDKRGKLGAARTAEDEEIDELVRRHNLNWRKSITESAKSDLMFRASWANLHAATRRLKLPEPGALRIH
jgi:hypothetical protein